MPPHSQLSLAQQKVSSMPRFHPSCASVLPLLLPASRLALSFPGGTCSPFLSPRPAASLSSVDSALLAYRSLPSGLPTASASHGAVSLASQLVSASPHDASGSAPPFPHPCASCLLPSTPSVPPSLSPTSPELLSVFPRSPCPSCPAVPYAPFPSLLSPIPPPIS